MGITAALSQDLYDIRALYDADIKQLHTLIIDFFAASFSGYALSRAFYQKVENIVYGN